ncbi:hypothetical protein [Streptomyces sp. BBFR109]|uniref:hypothetical protein n=1 Tax=Streptomyces sp. BBFR109 TaxID=3448172 RepID=UPI003F7583D1
MMRRVQRFNSEASLQQQVCDYLRLRYPGVLFRSDYASGLKLTMHQAVNHKRLQSSRAWPDLFIYEPRGGCQGLALELKREDVKIYKLDGTLRSDPHLREQAAMLGELAGRGYRAQFVCGFDAAVKAIDQYLNMKERR